VIQEKSMAVFAANPDFQTKERSRLFENLRGGAAAS
jgi:hypothetical protein